MFGRKIPDKVMAPVGSQSGGQQAEKKTTEERMSMQARNEAVARRATPGSPETIVGEGTTILGGKIASKGTLRVDGRIEGELTTDDAVIVGPSGSIKGNVAARSVTVGGKIFGNILTREHLEIQPTGEVHGDIQTGAGTLIIEGGARLEGRCVMGMVEKPAEPNREKHVAAAPANAAGHQHQEPAPGRRQSS
ncbi:polymer-forming cytoskeletal protein [Candidatus Sumerlaeota bacterium]|nr:polymer-forming cytoskeletal protein [Candidatus Sumerlaeota bacterium]